MSKEVEDHNESTYTTTLFQILQTIDTAKVFLESEESSLSSSTSSLLLSSVSSLQSWNDDIEQTIINNSSYQLRKKVSNIRTTSTSYNVDPTNTGAVTTVEEVTIILHEKIFKLISTLYTTGASNNNHDSNNDNKTKQGSVILNHNINDNNEDINNATISLANEIISMFRQKNDQNVHNYNDKNYDIVIQLLSQLIRTSKNTIRWNRYLLMKKHKKIPDDSIHGLDSCYRLCCTGMIQLYLALLEIYCHTTKTITMTATEEYQDELAKNACMTLFHSTYGEAKEPINQKALQSIITPKLTSSYSSSSSSSSPSPHSTYCLPLLARLLVSSTSIQVMLALIKVLHNLVGSVPGILITFDDELTKLVVIKNVEGSDIDIEDEVLPMNLVSILVATLAWSVRSQSSSSSSSSSTTNNIASNTIYDENENQLLDQRWDVAIEIIRVLFALQNRHKSAYNKINERYPRIMTQLGVIIADILHLPNNDDRDGHNRLYECKNTALIILLDAPKEFSQFLLINHCIGPLLTMLWIQLNHVVIEQEGMIQSQSNAVSILPILILLNKLCQENDEIKKVIKEEIFPSEHDNDIQSTDDTEKRAADVTLKNSKNMNPIDAPKGTTRWKLIKLMTWTESNVKRCSSELLWTLCDGDSKEFVLRTGFGNAVHMLGLKGLVNIPKSNSK